MIYSVNMSWAKWIILLLLQDSKGVLQVALTGIVLVKRGHAVGNADDISRIPKNVFKEHSKAMFLAKTNDPWYCKVKEYMIHPEYDYATLNTIALVELDSTAGNFPMMPICWPSYFYNASRNLYAMGFQDDNKFLEKTLYSLEYVDTTLCQEFYNRVGYKTQDINTAPTHLVCGFAPLNRNSCVWDNGMVLASNTTGSWMLLGLGISGPGCAAPARFIEMLPYQPWIDSAIGLDQIEDQYRRNNKDAATTPNPLVTERGDRNTLFIRTAADTEDICNSLHNELVFHEKRKIVAPSHGKSVFYKISLIAQNSTNSFCSKVTLKSQHQDDPAIYTAENNDEAEFKMTNEFKIVIPPKVLNEETLDWEPWIKAEELDDQLSSDMNSFDTFLRLEFENEAELEIHVFRPKHELKANELANTSRRIEENQPKFNEKINDKVLKAFEDFSAEVRRRDAETEIKTNISTEFYLNDNKKNIVSSLELEKKHNKPVHVQEKYETTDKEVKFNEPLEMDLEHYDAVRLPENKPAVIVDISNQNKVDEIVGKELNNLINTDFRHRDGQIISEIIVNTKQPKTVNGFTEITKNKYAHINVTEETEAKTVQITENITPETRKSGSSYDIDSVHNIPKESALVKVLVSEAEELKSILQLIFIETVVLWIATDI